MPARTEQLPGLLVPDRRIDPVPGGGGEDQAVATLSGRRAVFEGTLENLDAGIAGQVPAGRRRELSP